MTWIAMGLGEVRRKDERFTPAVPLWSRQWTSRCRRPRKLFYIDFLLIFSRHDLPSASRRRKMLPCTEEEVEALFYFISILYLTLYPIRTLSIPFLTSRRYTVWEWHKRSLRVNTRLQRESAINTIHVVYIQAWNFFICNYRVEATHLFNLTKDIRTVHIIVSHHAF